MAFYMDSMNNGTGFGTNGSDSFGSSSSNDSSNFDPPVQCNVDIDRG